jgi:hypothetical protein
MSEDGVAKGEDARRLSSKKEKMREDGVERKSR